MVINTSFVKTPDEQIAVERFYSKIALACKRRKKISHEFFFFQAITAIEPAAGEHAILIRTSRRLSAGLLSYFLTNKDFQEKLLKECQRHAINFFQK